MIKAILGSVLLVVAASVGAADVPADKPNKDILMAQNSVGGDIVLLQERSEACGQNGVAYATEPDVMAEDGTTVWKYHAGCYVIYGQNVYLYWLENKQTTRVPLEKFKRKVGV